MVSELEVATGIENGQSGALKGENNSRLDLLGNAKSCHQLQSDFNPSHNHIEQPRPIARGPTARL